MRKNFCCDASRALYEDYYSRQNGGSPVFRGSLMQRGHGLGSILRGLFRSALPLIKSGAKSLGEHALRTGLEIANDVADGSSFKESAKRRIPRGIKSFAQSYGFIPQSGSGKRRRRKTVATKRKKLKRDIFD